MRWMLVAATGVLIGYLVGAHFGGSAERQACDSIEAECKRALEEATATMEAAHEILSRAESSVEIWNWEAGWYQDAYLKCRGMR